MPRVVLPEERIDPSVRAPVSEHERRIVDEVAAAASAEAVLVVGMAMNPFCRRARSALKGAGIDHRYLEFGSYLSAWRSRTALKMWTGWPTFPMVFVRGCLIGGADDVQRMVRSGELKRLLA